MIASGIPISESVSVSSRANSTATARPRKKPAPPNTCAATSTRIVLRWSCSGWATDILRS